MFAFRQGIRSSPARQFIRGPSFRGTTVSLNDGSLNERWVTVDGGRGATAPPPVTVYSPNTSHVETATTPSSSWHAALATALEFYTRHAELLTSETSGDVVSMLLTNKTKSMWASVAAVFLATTTTKPEPIIFSAVRFRAASYTENWVNALGYAQVCISSHATRLHLTNDAISRVANTIRMRGGVHSQAGLSLLRNVKPAQLDTLTTFEATLKCAVASSNWRFGLIGYGHIKAFRAPGPDCRDTVLSSMVYGGRYDDCIRFAEKEEHAEGSVPVECSRSLLDGCHARLEKWGNNDVLEINHVRLLLWSLNRMDKLNTWETCVRVFYKQGASCDDVCAQRVLDSISASNNINIAAALFQSSVMSPKAVNRFLTQMLPRCEWEVAVGVVMSNNLDQHVESSGVVDAVMNMCPTWQMSLAVATKLSGNNSNELAARIALTHGEWNVAASFLKGATTLGSLTLALGFPWPHANHIIEHHPLFHISSLLFLSLPGGFDHIVTSNYNSAKHMENVHMLLSHRLPTSARAASIAHAFASCVLTHNLRGRHDILRVLISRCTTGVAHAAQTISRTLVALCSDTVMLLEEPKIANLLLKMDTLRAHLEPCVKRWANAAIRGPSSYSFSGTTRPMTLSQHEVGMYLEPTRERFATAIAEGFHPTPYLVASCVASLDPPAPVEVVSTWLSRFPPSATLIMIETLLLVTPHSPTRDQLAHALMTRTNNSIIPLRAWIHRGMWEQILTHTGDINSALQACASSWCDALVVLAKKDISQPHPRVLHRVIQNLCRARQWREAVNVCARSNPRILADTLVKSCALRGYHDTIGWGMLNAFSSVRGWLRCLTTFHVFMALSVRNKDWMRCLATLSVMRNKAKLKPEPATCLLLLRLCGMCRVTAQVVVNARHRNGDPNASVVLTTSLKHTPDNAWYISTKLFKAASEMNIPMPSAFQTQGVYTVRKCLVAGQWETASALFKNFLGGGVDARTTHTLAAALRGAGQWSYATHVIQQYKSTTPMAKSVTLATWCDALDCSHHQTTPWPALLDALSLVSRTAPCWTHATRFLSTISLAHPHALTNAKAVDSVVDACAYFGAWAQCLSLLTTHQMPHSPGTVERVLLLLLKVGFTRLSIELLLHIGTSTTVAIGKDTSRLVDTLVRHCVTWEDAIGVISGCMMDVTVPEIAISHALGKEGVGWRVAFMLYNVRRMMGDTLNEDATISALVAVCGGPQAKKWEEACKLYSLHDGVSRPAVAGAVGTCLCRLGRRDLALKL